MTVSRSSTVVSATEKEHSPNSTVEIEPLTPAKEVEVINKSSPYETTPNSGKLVQNSENLGSGGNKDSVSNSNQGLRRSARLSLSSTSYNAVEIVSSRRKRKAVKSEKGEQSGVVDCLDLNVMEGIEKESGGSERVVSNARVSIKFDTPSSCEVKGSESVDNEIDCINDVNGTVERGISILEKGKAKVVMVDLLSDSSDSSSESSDTDNSSSDNNDAEIIKGASIIMSMRTGYKERFKLAARESASKYAHFSATDEQIEDPHVDDDDDDDELLQTEARGAVEDRPGPFSTAMEIIRTQAANMHAQQNHAPSNKIKSVVPLIWVPKEKKSRVRKVAPSLQDLCMKIMADNVDAITSLECVPDVLRHKLTQLLCDSRKMNFHFLQLLVTASPSEIRVRDCSWLTEGQLTKTFERIDTSNLTVLQLDQCGRCLPDYVLFSILGQLPNKLTALTSISLKGACRLSDSGLNALVSAAPALRSINLSCCSLITSNGIINLADKLGPFLKELYIDECCDIDANCILPALLKLQHLEVLSVSHLETVTDSFIIKFVAARGQNMRELVLEDCTKLTDRALKAVAESCPELCVIDLTKLCKLTDNALGYLTNGCQKIQTLKLCRDVFSDEAVAAYLEASGKPLKELSLNHVDKVSHHTALSLAKHAKNLQSLDLSWCREMTNEALGLIADGCLSLKTLKLFGCTQITDVFTDGHSNEEVKITGLKDSQILSNIELPDLLPLRYSAV